MVEPSSAVLTENSYSTPRTRLIHVIPNGIDTKYFKRECTKHRIRASDPAVLRKRRVTRRMSTLQNRLVNNVLPHVKTPGVRIVIAGTNPAPEIRTLASENVHITGWLEDIRDAYAEATLFVAPLRIGTGQQNKILEAMAMALPCITTQHVASGFPMMETTAPLQIANSPEGIARHIDRLLGEQRSQNDRSLSRRWVEKHCDWSASTKKLADTFVHSMSNETDSSVWPIQTPIS